MTTRSDDHGRAPPSAKVVWFGWLLGALLFSYGFFLRVAPSVMIDDLMRDLGVSATIVGNLSALYFYAYVAVQLPVGVLVDRWGPRRILAGGAVLCGLGGISFATAESLLPAYLGRLLIGAGSGVAIIGTLRLVSLRFSPARFALLTGLTAALGMAGAVAGQAPLAVAVALVGWRAALVGAAIFSAVLAAMIWWVIDDSCPADEDAPPTRTRSPLFGLRHALATPQILLLSIFGTLLSAPQTAFVALWGVPYMMETYGLCRTTAAASVSLQPVGWAIGAPLAGWLSDHVRRRKAPMLLGAVGALCCFTALVYLPGLPLGGAQALLLAHGTFSGAGVIFFATAREHALPKTVGATMGFVNMMAVASGMFIPPLVGWLLDLNWDGRTEAGARLYSQGAFQVAFMTLVACGVVAVALACAVRETHCRLVRQAA